MACGIVRYDVLEYDLVCSSLVDLETSLDLEASVDLKAWENRGIVYRQRLGPTRLFHLRS